MRKPTRICKICFDQIDDNCLFNLLSKNSNLCSKCRRLFKPKFNKFNVDGYKGIAIYDYDETIKAYLYQFKGCFDIELADIFLEPYYFGLRLMFDGFTMIPVPSYLEDDKERGFNHVVTIFSKIKLPMVDALIKTSHFKQANNTGKERKNIKDYLKIKELAFLKGKKILIVDDVYTTGSTMKACIELVETLHPKEIRILVMSKTIFVHSISPN